MKLTSLFKSLQLKWQTNINMLFRHCFHGKMAYLNSDLDNLPLGESERHFLPVFPGSSYGTQDYDSWCQKYK